MKNCLKFTFFLLITTFVSCTVKKNIQKLDIKTIDTNLYNLNDYVVFEKSIKSKDESYDHFVEVSTGIYPFFDRRKLKKESKRFIRKNTTEFINEANYYYDHNNNVKLILYHWKSNGSNENFKKEFENITNLLNSKIGQYDFINLEEDGLDETSRDDIKWTKTDVKAYLFRFKNNYNEITLAIYKN